jgi:hypothetical protein
MRFFPRRYESFPDILSVESSPFLDKKMPGLAAGSTKDISKEWTNDWLHKKIHRPDRTNTNEKKMPWEEYSGRDLRSEKEQILQGENDKLRLRLNVAANAISCKDYERERKNQVISLCSCFRRKQVKRKKRQEEIDDLSALNEAVCSQASTVQMGSSSSKTICFPSNNAHTNAIKGKKQKKHHRFASAKSRVQQFIVGLNKFDKTSTSKSNGHEAERTTPPCTPERDNKNDRSGNGLPQGVLQRRPKQRELQVSSQSLGIEEYKRQPIEIARRERQELLKELCGFHGNDSYEGPRTSQEKIIYALPVIHESFSITRTDSGSVCSRGENSTVCYGGVEI